MTWKNAISKGIGTNATEYCMRMFVHLCTLMGSAGSFIIYLFIYLLVLGALQIEKAML